MKYVDHLGNQYGSSSVKNEFSHKSAPGKLGWSIQPESPSSRLISKITKDCKVFMTTLNSIFINYVSKRS